MDRVVVLIDSALKLAVEIQVKLTDHFCCSSVSLYFVMERSQSFDVNNIPDAQTSSGPKLVDFKAALVKPENEVVTSLQFISDYLLGAFFCLACDFHRRICINFAADEVGCSEE